MLYRNQSFHLQGKLDHWVLYETLQKAKIESHDEWNNLTVSTCNETWTEHFATARMFFFSLCFSLYFFIFILFFFLLDFFFRFFGAKQVSDRNLATLIKQNLHFCKKLLIVLNVIPVNKSGKFCYSVVKNLHICETLKF